MHEHVPLEGEQIPLLLHSTCSVVPVTVVEVAATGNPAVDSKVPVFIIILGASPNDRAKTMVATLPAAAHMALPDEKVTLETTVVAIMEFIMDCKDS
jgi:hypothetical protein